MNGHWVETEVLVRVCDEVGDPYRFGFNGQEKDNEISGLGNHNTAEFWEYDTRLGRRWNLDPVDQISVSNYAVFRNNPIILTDVDGDCPLCPDPTTSKEGDVFSPGEELMDYILMDGLWTGVGGEFSTVDISASKIQELEFSSWAAKANWHLNEFMSDNWIGRISGPESSWTDADGFKNKGWPTMKYTWGTLANIFTLNMFSLQTSALVRTNIGIMNKRQIRNWTYEGVSLGVSIYNTNVPNNKKGNELGKRIDIYEVIIKCNSFSLINYGIRAVDYYQSSKEDENFKNE